MNGVIDTGLDSGFVLPVEMMLYLSEKEQAKCIKAKKLFGWKPKVGIDEGLRRNIEWVKENLT